MLKFTCVLIGLCGIFHLSAQKIVGHVVDAESHTGIPFATISIVDYQTHVQSDVNGVFIIQGKFPQELNLRISATGYDVQTVKYALSEPLEIKLTPIHLDFDELTVTAATNELRRNSVGFIELKSIKELNELPKISVGQMLEQIPGVYNSSTGPGISKPVIRGLQGVRVLTLFNGVRMEGQQWGGDHGMGISELGIGSLEVMKGPASLLYGADALGGVLYLSNELYNRQNEHSIAFSSHFESATVGSVNQLMYKGSSKNVKFIAGGRVASHADYRLPSGDFVKNSRFQDLNFKFGMGWHKGKWVGNLRYDYAQSTIGIPGHSHDSLPSTADFLSNKQLRKKSLPVQYLTNHIASFENKWILKRHSIQLLTSFTVNNLLEHDEKVTIPELSLNTYNLPYKLAVETRLKHDVVLKYGVQGMYLIQKNQEKAMSSLVPDATQSDNGVYLLVSWSRAKWRVLGGARADMRTLDSKVDAKFTESFSKMYAGYNFALGASYAIAKRHLLRVNATSGFRIPHLSELLSNGVHHGTFRYEVGARDLTTEKALQLDVSYEFNGEHLSLIVNPFVNQISDFVYLEPQNMFVQGLQVFKYRQAKEGVTQIGGDFAVHWHPHFAHILHLESSFSYLSMLSKEKEVYSLIPQPRWSNAVIARFEMKTKVKIDNVVVQYAYYLPQHTVSAFETTSADYGMLDLGMQMSFGKKHPVQLQLGVRNVTNTTAINHLSRLKTIGIQSVGRSYYAKLIIQLNFKKNEKSNSN